MKYALLLLTLISQSSFAAIIEKNQYDSKIYYTPTPSLDISVIDLQKDGAIMTLFLEYKGAEVQAEEEQIQAQYPGYKTQVLGAQTAANSLTLELPELGIKETVPVKQGQIGPYINYQFILTPQQVATLQKQPDILNKMKIEFPIQIQYYSKKLMEDIEIESDICNVMIGSSLKDVVVNLSRYKPKKALNYESTLDSLKKNILDECFSISPKQVNSFEQLLSLHVENSGRRQPLYGQTLDIRPNALKTILIPTVKAIFSFGEKR